MYMQSNIVTPTHTHTHLTHTPPHTHAFTHPTPSHTQTLTHPQMLYANAENRKFLVVPIYGSAGFFEIPEIHILSDVTRTD